MPNINDLKQSKFLTKADVDPPVLVTIRGWEQVNVAMEGAPPDLKYALHFNELDKPMVLNSTNGQIIAAVTGSQEFDDWTGRKIVLYNDPNISFAGKLTGGIRCRAPKNQPQPAPAAPPTHGMLGKPAVRPSPVVGTVGQVLSPEPNQGPQSEPPDDLPF